MLGIPVLVNYQAWEDGAGPFNYTEIWDTGHYSVVVGYDEEHVFLMDPWTLGSPHVQLRL